MNEKVANIKTPIKVFFFRWVEFTKPFHKMNNQQSELLALLLYNKFLLEKETTNPKIMWKILFDYDSKVKIADEMGIQMGSLENLLSRLRKIGVITKDNQITSHYIPTIDKKAKLFKIVINFHITDGH